jgi:hypothetical protein
MRLFKAGSVVAIGALLMALAAIALGASASKHKTVPSGKSGSLSAKCSHGVVTGAGFSTQPAGGLEASVPWYELFNATRLRRPSANRVQLDAYNVHGLPHAMSVTAYCGSAPGGLTEHKATKPNPGGPHPTLSAVTASCPRGQTPAFGGFALETTSNGYAVTRPVGLERVGSRDWKVTTLNLNSGSQKVTSYAYCTKGAPLAKTSKSGQVPSAKRRSAVAHCGGGKSAVSGGALGQFGDSGAKPYVYLRSMGQASAGHAWKATADNFGGSTGKLTVFAYCR